MCVCFRLICLVLKGDLVSLFSCAEGIQEPFYLNSVGDRTVCFHLHGLTYSISVPWCSSLYSQFTVLPQLWVTFCLCIFGSFGTFHVNKLVSFVSGFFTDQGVFEVHLFSNTSVLLLNSIPLCDCEEYINFHAPLKMA